MLLLLWASNNGAKLFHQMVMALQAAKHQHQKQKHILLDCHICVDQNCVSLAINEGRRYRLKHHLLHPWRKVGRSNRYTRSYENIPVQLREVFSPDFGHKGSLLGALQSLLVRCRTFLTVFYLAPFVAFRISCATSFGCDNGDAWLELIDTTVA